MANGKSMWTILPAGNEKRTECWATSLMVFIKDIKRGKEKDLYRPQFPFLASISSNYKNSTGDYVDFFVILHALLDHFSHTYEFYINKKRIYYILKVYKFTEVMNYGILLVDNCIKNPER